MQKTARVDGALGNIHTYVFSLEKQKLFSFFRSFLLNQKPTKKPARVDSAWCLRHHPHVRFFLRFFYFSFYVFFSESGNVGSVRKNAKTKIVFTFFKENCKTILSF